jgi:hypothetical protein
MAHVVETKWRQLIGSTGAATPLNENEGKSRQFVVPSPAYRCDSRADSKEAQAKRHRLSIKANINV